MHFEALMSQSMVFLLLKTNLEAAKQANEGNCSKDLAERLRGESTFVSVFMTSRSWAVFNVLMLL